MQILAALRQTECREENLEGRQPVRNPLHKSTQDRSTGQSRLVAVEVMRRGEIWDVLEVAGKESRH